MKRDSTSTALPPHDDAQPCPQCTQAIVKFGIEHVFFTKKNDELGYFHRSVKTPEDCCNFHAPSFDMAMMGQEDNHFESRERMRAIVRSFARLTNIGRDGEEC